MDIDAGRHGAGPRSEVALTPYGIDWQLTKAIRRLSGSQQGTLIVPCPPKSRASNVTRFSASEPSVRRMIGTVSTAEQEGTIER